MVPAKLMKQQRKTMAQRLWDRFSRETYDDPSDFFFQALLPCVPVMYQRELLMLAAQHGLSWPAASVSIDQVFWQPGSAHVTPVDR